MGAITPSHSDASWPSAIHAKASAAPSGPATSIVRAPILFGDAAHHARQ